MFRGKYFRGTGQVILKRLVCIGCMVGAVIGCTWADDTESHSPTLKTRWASDVSPHNPLPEYPRPQMVRAQWKSLNGPWDYSIVPLSTKKPPAAWDGKILVPFAAESLLSGVQRTVGEENLLWYRREFEVPPQWQGKRIILHFDAVDWESSVYVNGHEAGSHRGGYSRFSFDITPYLKEKGSQILEVKVWDPTDTHWQPRGKQVNDPKGIMYTAVTGIWQPVWIEPVGEASIESLSIEPDIDNARVTVIANTHLPEGKGGPAPPYYVRVEATGNGVSASAVGRPGQPIDLAIENPRLWSPEDPFLYDLQVTLFEQESPISSLAARIDHVESYFGLRNVSLREDDTGITRIFLNRQPVFMFGPLDQGWWPDGLYTAPTDEALRYDIEVTRKLGYNMCRKHVKVESDRWYYWCDKLGLLVWQDMPNGDRAIHPAGGEITRTKESADNFRAELREVITQHQAHPSIVFWIPFNEGWGQFETREIVGWIKQQDPTRLVIGASGWNDIRGVGDAHDLHIYPGPGSPEPENRRAAVLGEFGGLGLPLPGHLWQEDRNWGYRSFKNQKELQAGYIKLINRLRPFIRLPGLSAAVYTQTTDVEGEVNGLMTYDREVMKLGSPEVVAANQSLYTQPKPIKWLAPTSRKHSTTARYTTTKPEEGWITPEYDDTAWKEGIGGFGNGRAWNAIPRTAWKTDNIWLRRKILLRETPQGEVVLLIYHDDTAEVYVNGHAVEPLVGADNHYRILPLSAAATDSLKAGENIVAVHCHNQENSPGFIDFGMAELVEKEEK